MGNKKIYVIEDAAHAIGSDYQDTKVGSCKYSDMTVFSFHPVKTITTAEGGCVTTNDKELYDKLCAFRAHGMHKDGDMVNDWRYEMRELGYNYRMTDVQAALAISQLKRLDEFKKRRREIVDFYNKNSAFSAKITAVVWDISMTFAFIDVIESVWTLYQI